MSREGRAGFTLIELTVVALIISLLAGIAVPNLQRALLKARATDALGNINVIEVAVLNYQADNNQWPPDRNRGTIPPGLERYLPTDFSFVHENYTLDYDNWSTQDPGIVAVTLITDDQELGLALLDMLGPNSWTNGNQKYTRVIEWVD